MHKTNVFKQIWQNNTTNLFIHIKQSKDVHRQQVHDNMENEHKAKQELRMLSPVGWGTMDIMIVCHKSLFS